MRLLELTFPLACLLTCACGLVPAAGVHDADDVDEGGCFLAPDVCADEAPAPDHACLPACGNPLGVGQPCTQGGGECNRWSYFERGEAGFCSVDFRDVELGYCSRPCERDEDCGCGAVCVPDPDDPNSSGCRIDGCPA